MSEQELKNLQIYIGKRNQNQTDEQVIEHIQEYMIHTVYGRNENVNKKRIEVLKELIKYLTDNKEECLNETMINAGWFGETEIEKFLIENGANKEYKNKNGLGLLECAERAEKQFKDNSLKLFLKDTQ